MAPKPATVSLTAAVLLLAVACLVTSPLARAHQLSDPNGAVVPHQHVYKRSSYGNGFVSGHVVQTRHGHNMIIWSPAPSNSFSSSAPQMRIAKPNRQRLQQPQRAQGKQPQIRNLRNLNPRDDRD